MTLDWRRGQFGGEGYVDHRRCAVHGNAQVTLGRHSYATGLRVYGWDGQQVRIGRFTSIGDDTAIVVGGHHDPARVATSPIVARLAGAPEDESKGDVVIGNDVWIGQGVIILSGVTISDGSIVAAGSVVNADVPPYSIVGGSPAKLIRPRFSSDIAQRLQALAWWDWPDELIAERYPLFADPERLLATVSPTHPERPAQAESARSAGG